MFAKPHKNMHKAAKIMLKIVVSFVGVMP